MTSLRSSCRVVKEIKIDVIETETSERFFDRIVGILTGVFVMPDFGCYVDGRAGEWGLFNGFLNRSELASMFVDDRDSPYADFGLIAIELRCVYVTIALIEGSQAGSLTGRRSPDAETKDRDSIFFIDRDCRFDRKGCDCHDIGFLKSLGCSPGLVEQLNRGTTPDHYLRPVMHGDSRHHIIDEGKFSNLPSPSASVRGRAFN